MLGKAIKEFGDLSGIVFNLRTGHLVGGHQRIKCFDPEWEIMKEKCSDNLGTVARGYVKTPFGDWTYREVDWDKKKEAAANIAANRHGGEFDIPMLKDIIAELDDGCLDIELTGFDANELKSIFNNLPTNQEKELDEMLETNIECPKCGYRWKKT